MKHLRTIKKTAMVVVLAQAAFTFTPGVQAGVPTISPAELAQQVANAQQQAKEAIAQLNKAKEAIAQAKSQYDHYKGLIEGNSNLGDFLKDPS